MLWKEKLSALESKVDQVAKDAKDKTALLVLVNESKISAFGDGSRYGMVYQNLVLNRLMTASNRLRMDKALVLNIS